MSTFLDWWNTRFAEGASTRVDLEHRLLHYYGENAPQMRGIFDSEQVGKGSSKPSPNTRPDFESRSE